MFSERLSKLCLPLVLSGFLVAACSSPRPTETKAASPDNVQPAPAPAAAEEPRATVVPITPPAEKPHRKTAQVADVQPPAPLPQAAPAPAPPPPPPAPVAAPPVAPQPVAPPPPPPPPIPVIDTRDVTLPAGTAITISMIDSVDSSTAHVGDTFRATIDQPFSIGNDVVLQKGADAVVRVTDVSSAGRVKGESELHLVLDRVTVGKKAYTVDTNVFEEQGSSQGKKAVRNGALGAALGAAIGAIAGGGKGAAIGAGAGGGGGVGATAVMKGDQVRVASETKLMFTLNQPVNVTITAGMPASINRATAVPPRDRFNTQR